MARPKQRIGIDRESRSLKRAKRSDPGQSPGGTSSSSQEIALGDEPSVDTSESEGLVLPETWLEDAMQQQQEAEITVPRTLPEVQPQICTLAGEHVTTADVDVTPAVRNCENSAAAQERGFDCTTCGKTKWDILEHPQLGVGICRDCRDFLFSSPYTKSEVDGSEEQCRWCGEGGEIVMCDDCDRAFCRGCIVRNFSPHDLHAIVNSVHWSCYSCKPETLRNHVEGFKRFKASVREAHCFPDRRRLGEEKARTGRKTTNFPRKSDGEGATIAELLAQDEERRRQNPDQWTKPRRKPRPKNAARGSNRKASSSHQTGMNKRHFDGRSNSTIEEIINKGGRPPQPPVVTYIRPHQYVEKRREAAERRRRAEQAERLKNITNDNTNEGKKNMVTDHKEKTIIIINDNDEKNDITNDGEKKVARPEMVVQVKSEYGDDGEKRNVEKVVFYSEVSGGDLMQTTEDAFAATAKNLFANFTGVNP